MRKQHQQPLRNNCRQLALIVLGFVLCISLLESKGLVIWAQRLEVGTTQQKVLSTMETLDGAWSAVAAPVTDMRPRALEFLRQHGWSDVPVDAQSTEPVENKTGEQAGGEQTGGQAGEPTGVEGVENGQGEGRGTVDPVATPESTQPVPPEVSEGPEGCAPCIPETGITETPRQEMPEQRGQSTVFPESWLPLVQPGKDGKLVQLPALEAKQSRRVVLAGDSMMAVGLAAQLQRDLVPFKETVSTAKAYRSATGLGRPDVFDWQKEYPVMIGSKKPDVIIVAIGANDTQNFEVNRKVFKIGSDEWRALYTQRLTNYLDMLTKDGAVVLWIKLPPMRPTKYNNDVTIVNEVAQAVVAKNPRAIWWDVSNRLLNSNGKYVESAALVAGQRQVRIRQGDGIHLTDHGAKLITEDIVAWLNLTPPPAPPVVGEAPLVNPLVSEAPATSAPVPTEVAAQLELAPESATTDETAHEIEGVRSEL